jgi:hypothetical protein
MARATSTTGDAKQVNHVGVNTMKNLTQGSSIVLRTLTKRLASQILVLASQCEGVCTWEINSWIFCTG